MEKVTYRRTLNIGDYETLTIETTVEHEDFNTARLFAAQKFLETAKLELIRIYGIKVASTGNAYDRIEAELSGVKSELTKLT